MIGITLSRYFAGRFIKWVVGLFVLVSCLVFLFDFLELVRRASEKDAFTMGRAVMMSLMRVPSLTEQALPFITLFGAIAAFHTLSRRLELVVARSAGISVWQFSAPIIVAAIVLGLFAVGVYNPVSAWMKSKSDALGVILLGKEQRVLLQTTGDTWLRQNGDDGESVINARVALEQGQRLVGVTVFTFDQNGRFDQRIDADEAVLTESHWTMKNAIVQKLRADPVRYNSYLLSTFLKPEQIRQSLAAPDTVSIWELPSFIELATHAGLPAYRYRLQYQTLLARPLLLAAMVLLAATVSLGFGRFGGTGRMILGGITAGFVLYVVDQFAKDLGGAGIVPPGVAAWSPGVVATLIGFSILLHREDG
ncbi:MAG: LPS export ABC transporter permease LptG [Hyphomicrobiales bacterium]|nr:MAG: LPS export ABC transporter permease LptG [Hyphomicrobiales bacterium]